MPRGAFGWKEIRVLFMESRGYEEKLGGIFSRFCFIKPQFTLVYNMYTKGSLM
jgi:hypothetical protein